MKIAIASGKGGTGKTTLSTNLVHYMAREHEVVLTDLDVEEPNSGLFIQAKLIHEEVKNKMVPDWDKEACILCRYCQKVCNFNAVIQAGNNIMVFPELCHSCYACSELCPVSALPMIHRPVGRLRHYTSNNLHFVEGRLNIGEEQAVPMIHMTKEYSNVHFHERFIKIFDSPPGTSCPVIEAVRDTDYVILVTEPTPFGLHDLKLAVNTMREMQKPFGVVINRYGIGNEDVIRYCRQEDIQVLAKIPNSRKIAELYSQGRLVYDQIPEVKKELEIIKDFIVSFIKENH